MKNTRKWLAKLVAVLLVMGLLPVTPGMMTARADDDVMDVNLNIGNQFDGIVNPVPRGVNGERLGWTGSKVYFGMADSAPVLWRVLDPSHDPSSHGTFNAKGGKNAFLLSENFLMKKTAFHSRAAIWQNSSLRQTLNETGFKTWFGSAERKAVSTTTLTDTSTADKLFLMSLDEVKQKIGNAENPYGLDTMSSRNGADGTPMSDSWWLRTSGGGMSSKYVDSTGSITASLNSSGKRNTSQLGVRPAINLDLSKVMFITVSGAGISDFSKTGYSHVLQQNYTGEDENKKSKYNNSWDLTLSGGTGFSAGRKTGETEDVPRGGIMNVTVSEVGTAEEGVNYDRISAMLLDGNNKVICYGKISDDVQTGDIAVPIPSDVDAGVYKLRVFAEDANSVSTADATDFASNMSDSITVNVIMPVYGISAEQTDITFTDTVYGNPAPPAQAVTIKNNGNVLIAGFSIVTKNAADFEVTGPVPDAAAGNGGKTAFTVRPRSGLAVGTYNGSLIVSDMKGLAVPVTVTLSFTVLSEEDTPANLNDTQEGDTLEAGRNAIYASPSNASESDAEIRYCDTTIGFDPATLSDAAEIQHFKLGKSQKLKSFTWNGVTYTKWKVFFTEDTTTCKYIYVMHNQAWDIAFDGNGGTAGTASGKTDEDGYLTSLPTASRSSYTFAGWYTEKTGGTQVSKSTKFTAPAKLYAHWTLSGGSTGGDSDGGTAYTGSSGKWLKDSTGWWYQNSDGTWPSNTWKQINGKWYHFDSNGYMQTGWILDNGKWYYLGGDGAMVTGLFHAPDGHWYYFRADGSMAVGDVTVDGKQRHFNDQLPPNPTYDKDPDTGIWYPNGNKDLPYGAETE